MKTNVRLRCHDASAKTIAETTSTSAGWCSFRVLTQLRTNQHGGDDNVKHLHNYNIIELTLGLQSVTKHHEHPLSASAVCAGSQLNGSTKEEEWRRMAHRVVNIQFSSNWLVAEAVADIVNTQGVGKA